MGSVGALEDIGAKDDEYIVREVPPGVRHVVAAKGSQGPGVEGAAARVQACEGAGRVQVSAPGSEIVAVRAQVN